MNRCPNNKVGTLDTLPNDYDYDVGSIITRNIRHKEGNFEISSVSNQIGLSLPKNKIQNSKRILIT